MYASNLSRPSVSARPRPAHTAPRGTGPRPVGRLIAVRCVASAQATQLLAEAKTKYERGDRLSAMKLFEDALAKASTTSQRQAALYGCTAVHASFGDVELAQMTVREAIREGLDFEMAVNDLELVQINSSPQIMIQLKNFAKRVRQAEEDGPARSGGGSRPTSAGLSSTPSSVRPGSSNSIDLDSIIGPGSPQEEAVDASPAAIAKRVTLLFLALIGLGVALFYFGLEYMF